MQPWKIKKTTLIDYPQTVREIVRLSRKYCGDLTGILPGNFELFFFAVSNIPYREDAYNEVVARPRYILASGTADCKKKSILIASYCYLHDIGVRFVVMSSRSDREPHHIYTEILTDEGWCAADATYPGNRLGVREYETFREVWE